MQFELARLEKYQKIYKLVLKGICNAYSKLSVNTPTKRVGELNFSFMRKQGLVIGGSGTFARAN